MFHGYNISSLLGNYWYISFLNIFYASWDGSEWTQNLRTQRANFNKQVSSHPIFPLARETVLLDYHNLPVTSITSLSSLSTRNTEPTLTPHHYTHIHTQPQTHSLSIHNLLLVLLFSPPPAHTLHTSSAVVALAVPQDCYSSGWSTINTLKAQSPTLPPEQSTPLATLRLPAPASPWLTTRSQTEKNGSQISRLWRGQLDR